MGPLWMSGLILAGLGAFGWTALGRWKLMSAARAPANRFDQPAARWWGVLKYMFGQLRMFRYRLAGLAHALIFIGFSVLLLRTLILFARGFTDDPHFGFWLFDDDAWLGKAYLLIKDVIGVLVIVGVAYFLYLRLVVRPKRMEHSAEGIFILLMILGIVLSDLTYEAAGYVIHPNAAGVTPAITPAAYAWSAAIGALPESATYGLYAIGFWLHSILVLAFLNFLPYGKHFHILTVLPNVYLRDLRGIGRFDRIEDIEGRIERGDTLGIKTARDLSWKAVLDLYTCTECGRCTDHCPAHNTGKLLSPKHLTMAIRDHMYTNARALTSDGAPPAADAASSSQFVTPEGQADETQGVLAPVWVNPEVLWACTTCGACEQECPVFISYVDKIIGMRRNLVLERGEFPAQLQNAFRGLESAGNVYSFGNEQRADWAAGLGVPLIDENPGAEILYWVGCAPSFDDRARKIARATARLMQLAGVNFAILGPAEQCSGDPARRSGNEYLFQILAQTNVDTLNQAQVKRVVTTCPHCFHTLLNEYPSFGGQFEVIHHTAFLSTLVREGRLSPKHHVDASIVFHDSCYLGRYNGVYDAPRDLLHAIPGLQVVEAVQSRDRGMCCGAGGAQMWKEEEPIRLPESKYGNGKVNHARTRQLLKVLPSGNRPRQVASACPFCLTMLRDGLRDQGHEDVESLDVAEVLLKSVEPPA